ncbi:MEKHLA domain-containing protein [Fuerstiella marisgermanici]|uniref:MEKHLA domain protein n=1 Tax=Fuerstiella marisgermanici TaxID=1891926 RepID=A0A1P8WEJ1_9PLAN|nr:MEKHLA domain-containing protein [Fuerstiella marisgermanici]APZ92471.1 MEKHLA domain protein [Fuerstiella marisgermanici]
MNDQPPPWSSKAWIAWTTRLLNSYRKFVGKDLIPRTSADQDSQTLYHAPFVVVAHGTEDDPLLNYGNQAALDLWQMSLDELIGTPSRKTAEPVHRDERAELLRRTREHGYIDDYTGIRIASTGQRFRIHQATVWNVVDGNDAYVGQAAAFADWTMLTE